MLSDFPPPSIFNSTQSSILGLDGGSLDFRQVCWKDGNTLDSLVTLNQGSDSTNYFAKDNFVAEGENIGECREKGKGVYTADLGCVSGADDSIICLSDRQPTQAPTVSPAPTEAIFLRQVPCPGYPSIRGYISIQDINNDMRDEVDRTMQDSPPSAPYMLSLCPGITFDTNETPLLPVLDNAIITCGGFDSGYGSEPCVISGGEVQILIENHAIPGYNLTSVSIEGMIFENFSGASIVARGESSTKVLVTNSQWLVGRFLCLFLVMSWSPRY